MENSKYSKENSKKSFWKDKKNIAIVILSFLLLMSFGSNSNEDTAKLKNEISSLQTEVEELNQELEIKNSEDSTAKIEDLEKQIDDKDTYIQNLEAQINTLNEETTANASQTSSSDAGTSYTVYVTNTGDKYHRDGCKYLKKSKIAKDKNDAVSQGYTACSVCNP